MKKEIEEKRKRRERERERKRESKLLNVINEGVESAFINIFSET